MNRDPENSLPPLSSLGNRNLTETAPAQKQAITDDFLPKLGPYRVCHEIGRGGMGVVYLAIQEQPVEREVALKVIRDPNLGQTIIDECKSLAAMNHPNVAVIYDGGTDTISKVPYFAMEYVDGKTLVDYCDQNCLSIKDRLKIFVQVCDGVQHAHKKQIIHRDLKPANVLVAERDGDGIPKVIDFGLSTDLLENKASGSPSGTWEYMSPEQAQGELLDTQTDIYSLAVILHELLTGELPIASSKFSRTGSISTDLPINVELITTELPAKASLVFDKEENIQAFSTKCPDNIYAHRAALKNDYDFIIEKGLNKEPELRYDSAKGFADDVLRVMKHEVPLARPSSRSYSSKKFVRRNMAMVTAIALLILVSLSGTAVSTLNWLRANESAKVAIAAREEERIAKDKAIASAKEAIAAEKKEGIAKEDAEEQAANANFQLGNYLASQNRILDSERSFSQIPRSHRNMEWWLTQKSIDASDFTSFAHTSLVSEVGFSDSGRLVVSAGHDNKAVVWNVETGAAEHFLLHDDSVTSIDIRRDDSIIVTASRGGGLAVWNTADGKLIKRISLPSGKDATCVRFGWGGMNVVAGAGNEVVSWDYSSDTIETKFKHSAEVLAICLSPDGKTIASSSRSQDIRVWEYDSGDVVAKPQVKYTRKKSPKVLGTSEADFNYVVSMDFSPDGRELAFSVASPFGERPAKIDSVGVWNFEEKKGKQAIGHEGGTSGIQVSPDGSFLVTVGYDNLIKTWRRRDLRLLSSKTGHGQAIETLDLSRDGSRLVTAGGMKVKKDDEALQNGPFDFGLKFWSMKNDLGSHMVVPKGSDPSNSNQMTADGSHAFLLDGKLLRILKIDDGSVKNVKLSDDASKVVLSKDEETLAVLLENKRIVLLTISGEIIHEVENDEKIVSLVFTKNGTSVLLASSDNSLRLCNVETGKIEAIGNTGNAVLRILAPDQNQCVTIGGDQTIRTWDLSTQSELRCIDFTAPAGQTSTHACLSEDNSTLAIATGSIIQLFDFKRGKPVGSFAGHRGEIRSLKFSSDKKRLFSSADDHTIRIWNVETEKEILHFDTAKLVATELFLHNDDRRLAFFSEQGDLHFFHFPETTFVTRLHGHQFPVFAVEFPSANTDLLYSRSKKSSWSNEEWLVWKFKEGKLMDGKELKEQTKNLLRQNKKLKPEFEFVNIKSANKCSQCQVSTDGTWTAVPSGNEIILVQRPKKDSFEAFSRMKKSQVDSNWHFKKGVAAEKDQDNFAAAFHFSWALKSYSDSELESRFNKSFKSLPSPERRMLREQTKMIESVPAND